VEALGRRFASRLRSATGGDLGLVAHCLPCFNLFLRRLKVSEHSIGAN